MGAWNRRFENKIERQLIANKSKGVLGGRAATLTELPPAPRNGDSRDYRLEIPPLGLSQYWYVALPAKKVGKKPLYWNMLGQELVFFRDEQGEVAALTDICPHRNSSLSDGWCFYKGFVSCPFHGATFNGEGECVAFLCEGPDSSAVGKMRARKYPTRELKGWVFIWMGDGEPVPIEEDVPPEFFEKDTILQSSYTYWHTNWMLGIENHSDSHNTLYVHRNSIQQLTNIRSGRTRTPIAPRSKVINGRGLHAIHLGEDHYAKDGQVPYQMYYPGVKGTWPLHRFRLSWVWFFDLFRKKKVGHPVFRNQSEEWGLGHHLPCIVRQGGGGTRYAVAVEPNLSRIVYFYIARPKTWLGKVYQNVWFHLWRKPLAYHFSGQDRGATIPCRYWEPEFLVPTDSPIAVLRKVIVEESRDAQRKKEAVAERVGPMPERVRTPERVAASN